MSSPRSKDPERPRLLPRLRFPFGAPPPGAMQLLDEHSTFARKQSEHGRNGSHWHLFSRMHQNGHGKRTYPALVAPAPATGSRDPGGQPMAPRGVRNRRRGHGTCSVNMGVPAIRMYMRCRTGPNLKTDKAKTWRIWIYKGPHVGYPAPPRIYVLEREKSDL